MRDATQAQLELRVVSGLHQGAALPLLDDQVTVGSGDDCDVILLDDDVQSTHLTLIRAENGSWMTAPDQQAIDLGRAIAIGRAAIMICEVGSPWQPAARSDSPDIVSPSSATHRRGFPRTHPLAFRLMCVCLGFLCLSGISFITIYSSSPVAPTPLPHPAASAAPHIASPDQLEQRVTRLFKDWGVNDLVELRIVEKTIQIDGVLSPSELQRVNSVVSEIHREWGSDVKVELRVHPLQTTLPFEIREVFYGPVPNITLSDGARLFVGDSYLGVRLSEIRPGLMVFNGTRKIEVTW